MKYILSSVILGVLVGCASLKNYTPEEVALESKRINDFFERVFQEQLNRSPQFDTYIGGKNNYGKLDDLLLENEFRELEITKANLKELKKFNYHALDEQSRISYRIFEYIAERAIGNFKFRHHSYPLNQMFGVQAELASFMMNMHRVENAADAEAYVSRLHEFKRVFAEVLAGLKVREEKGIIPPKFVYGKVTDDIKNLLTGAPFTKTSRKSPLWEDFSSKVGALKISAREKKALLEKAEMALTGSVKPALAEVAAYMNELETRAPEEAGAGRMPDGGEFYASQLAFHTSTGLSADEIHEIGLSEVRRIHQEMDEIRKKVGFAGDLQAFFKHLQTSEKFRFADSKKGKNEYLKRSTKFIDDMKKRLDQLFTIKPKAGLVVKAVEPYREKSAGSAFYEGPSADGKRSGIFYVNLYNMAAATTYEMEALAYHEGIPGHHMQIAISTELQNIPKFRKYAWMTAYGEGWGLYSEMIPKEIGLYQDPYSDFGRLTMELWRAVRLVVDTGLHAKGWTRRRTIDYMVQNTPSVPEEAENAVNRYLVMPGQATAYKIGMLKILELRKNAKAKLGEKFDLRAFHDEILRNGAMPLTMLEEQIEGWIARNAGEATKL